MPIRYIIKLMIIAPLEDFVEVSALMHDIEVWVRIWVVLDPSMSDHSNVRMAHECLTKHLNAMS